MRKVMKMIDIPIGKALVPLEIEGIWRDCRNCALFKMNCRQHIVCHRKDREDGKNVIFKLVDWNGEILKKDKEVGAL